MLVSAKIISCVLLSTYRYQSERTVDRKFNEVRYNLVLYLYCTTHYYYTCKLCHPEFMSYVYCTAIGLPYFTLALLYTETLKPIAACHNTVYIHLLVAWAILFLVVETVATGSMYSCRGRKVYEPPRYMTVAQAASQLLEVVESKQRKGEALRCKNGA